MTMKVFFEKYERRNMHRGVSMVSLVITIVVILILSAIAFMSSTGTIGRADYSKYVTNVSDVSSAFHETSTSVNGDKTSESNQKNYEQVYNYVAKDGVQEEDFLPKGKIPTYTVIKDEGQIGIKLPNMKLENGNGKKVPVKYATTKSGQIFTWPPYEHEGKLYITDTDTVEHKFQTEIMIGDEKFEITLDEDGNLLEMPEIEDEFIDPNEHRYILQMQTPEYLHTEASCTAPAVYYYKCAHCDDRGTETYVIGAALGHNFGAFEVTKEASCMENGIRESKCSRCGESQREDIPINEGIHKNEKREETKSATCTEAGTATFTCAVCNAPLRTESIPALGHNFGEYMVTKAANCAEKGQKERKCSNCGKSETQEIPVDTSRHYGEEKTEITQAASCTQAGLITYKCTVCNKTIRTEEITQLGHSHGEFVVTQEPTCTVAGSKQKVCSGCNDTIVEEIPATGHKYTIIDVTPPTTTEEGFTTYTCEACGDSYIDNRTGKIILKISKEKLGEFVNANNPKNIVFTTMALSNGTDVSEDGNGYILANINGETCYVAVKEEDKKIILPEDSSNFFSGVSYVGYKTVESIDLTALDVTGVTTMKEMFNGCEKLQQVTFPSDFAFVGTDGFLPVPSEEHITDADGKWYDIVTGNAYESVSIPQNQAATYTAVNTKYTISYDLKGGTFSGQIINNYRKYSLPITLSQPVKEGYTFVGWTGSNGSIPEISIVLEKGTIGNKSYVANYSALSYNISIDCNGGSGVSNRTYTPDTETFTLDTPTREGYTFTGWTGSNGTTPQVVVNIEKGSIGDKNYIANWTVNGYEYNVVYKSTTGLSLGNIKVSNAYGTTNEIIPPEKLGYNKPASQIIAWDSVTPKTIEFVYEPIVYNVSFNLDGGTGVSNRTYTIETSTFTLGMPSKNGYTFTGWSGSNGVTPQTAVSIEKGSTGDKSYTANYSAVAYNITIDCNGGMGVSNRTYTIETSTFTLGTPIRVGYEFTGWTGSNGSTPQKSVSIAKGSTGDKNYKANWQIINYTITYDLDGGTLANSNPRSYNILTSTFILNNPSKAGYTFAGWTGSNSSTPEITVSLEKGSTGDKEYKANWTVNGYEYNIVYKSTSGKSLGNTTVSKAYGTTNVISAPEKEGYTTPVSQTVVWDSVNAKTITFEYEPISYSITIDCKGGSGVASTSYTIETATFTLGTPSRNGYTFSGWTGSNGSTPQTTVSITKGSTGAKSYAANWTAISYNITIDCNGGSGVSNRTYTIETATFRLGTPTRTGYTFTGWTGSNGTTPQTSVSIAKGSTGDKNYKANWTATSYEYNVVYKSTSGKDLGTATVTNAYGTTNTVTPPAKTGYTTPASQSVTWDSITAKTIEFKYTPISYNIKVNLDGGTDVSNRTYTIETETFSLATPTKTGHSFVGWTGSNGTTAQSSVSIEKGSTGDKEYTANWTAVSYTYNVVYKSTSGKALGSATVTKAYGTTNTVTPVSKTGYTKPASQSVTWDSTTAKTITFTYTPTSYNITIDCAGGTGVSSTTYTIETASFTLGTPTRTGYTFTGWTGSNGTTAQKTVTISQGSTGAKNYTANWTGNTGIAYTVKHWQQYVNGGTTPDNTNFALANTQNLTGTAGASVTPSRKTYTGFTAPSVQTVTIAGDGSTVVNYYYTRNSYAVTLRKGTGIASVSGAGTYKYGATVTINATVNSGYTWKDWTGYSLITTQNYSFTMPASAVSYTANAVSSTATYTVNHWQQKVAGGDEENSTNFTLEGTTTGTTTVGSEVTPSLISYTGFNKPATQTVIVAADGSTEVNYYYTRKSYTVSLTKGTGISAVSGAGTYKYGASVTINATVSSGYTWTNWTGYSTVTTKNYTFTMPASAVTYTANATANTNTAYTVKHWQQKVSGGTTQNTTNFALADTQNLTGTSGASVTPSRKTYTGFTAPSGQTVTIAGDGTTVVNYYYTRNSYTLTLNKGTGISTVTGANTYKYGATVTINATVSTGYAWKNWTGYSTVTTQNYTFTMPASNVTYTANATATEVEFTVTSSNRSMVGYTGAANENLVIPATFTNNGVKYKVVAIGEYAFGECNNLVSVTIPNTVKTIYGGAFVYCEKLTTVTIPEGVVNLLDTPFRECREMTSLTIPSTVTNINTHPCYCCYKIPNFVVSSSNTAYCAVDGVIYTKDKKTIIAVPEGRTGSFTIPNTVTTIGQEAFISTNLNVTIPTSVTTIKNGAFINASFTSITIPNSVKTIEEQGFWNCYRITSITIPSSVTSIGDMAFGACYNLTSITVNSSNSYFVSENGVLYNKGKTRLLAYPPAKSGTSFTIPSTVTTLDSYAFSGCEKLTSIVIAGSVKTLPTYSFSNCNSLTSITIPASVTSVGGYAFYDCNALKNVYYKGTSTQWSSISINYGNTPLTSATKTYNY